MRRFSFPLERVRKWRQDRAEMEEMRLRQLYAETRTVEADRKTIVDEAVRSGRAVLAQRYVTSQDLSALAAFKEYAAEQIRRLDVKLVKLAAGIREQQALVLETNRDFQLLDGLRDRALLSWTAARDKEQEELAAELFLAKRSHEASGTGRGGVRIESRKLQDPPRPVPRVSGERNKRVQTKRNGLNSRRPAAETAPILTSIS